MKTSKLAEQQIRKAQAEGQLDNLKGAGEPLKRESGDTAERKTAMAKLADLQMRLSIAEDARRKFNRK